MIDEGLTVQLVVLFLQGTVLDRIDYNVDKTATKVEQGLKQLQKVSFDDFFHETESLIWYNIC